MHAAQIRPRVGATRRDDMGRDDDGGGATQHRNEIEINATRCAYLQTSRCSRLHRRGNSRSSVGTRHGSIAVGIEAGGTGECAVVTLRDIQGVPRITRASRR